MSRNQQIEAAYATGASTLEDIGRQFGLSGERIRQIAEVGIAAGRIKRRKPVYVLTAEGRRRAVETLIAKCISGELQHEAKRNAAIEAALSEGASFNEIARRFGVSRNVPAGIAWRRRRREQYREARA